MSRRPKSRESADMVAKVKWSSRARTGVTKNRIAMAKFCSKL